MAAAFVAGCAAVPAPHVAPAPEPMPGPPPASAAAPPPASAEGASFSCQDGSSFRLLEQGDFIVIEGLPGGPHRLARDAGGFTPGHSVWSSDQLKAEFGLGNDPRSAALIYTLPPAVVRCTGG